MASQAQRVGDRPEALSVGAIETTSPVRVEKAGPLALSYYLVTTGQPITDSGGQTQHLFMNIGLQLGQIDTSKFKITISNLPDDDAPFVVDDALSVNGNVHGGFAGIKSDPKQSLGQDPLVSYIPTESLDISNELRSDGMLYLTALDLGGYTYCCSRLYVRVSPRP